MSLLQLVSKASLFQSNQKRQLLLSSQKYEIGSLKKKNAPQAARGCVITESRFGRMRSRNRFHSDIKLLRSADNSGKMFLISVEGGRKKKNQISVV